MLRTMTPLTSLRSLRSLPFALASLFVVVSVIAAFAYAINAWQVYGFAANVWQLPAVLCVFAALVADALSLAGLFTTYILRRAKLHVRAYAWFVFLSMTSLSILAAESFAKWRQLPQSSRDLFANEPSLIEADSVAGGVLDDANVAAAVIAPALALAVHLLIICVRHAVPASRDGATPAGHPDFIACPLCGGDAISPTVLAEHMARRHPAPSVAQGPPRAVRPVRTEQAPEPDRPVPVVREQAEKVQVMPPAPRRGGRRGGISAVNKANAVARVIAKEMTAAEVAALLDCSTRAVEQWVKAYREQQAGQPLAAMRTLTDGSGQVNGHKPEETVSL